MNATIAQVVERYIGNVEVTGPTPVSSLLEKRLKIKVFIEKSMVSSLIFLSRICHDEMKFPYLKHIFCHEFCHES